MKKLVAVVVLLAALVAISYYQVQRRQGQETQIRQEATADQRAENAASEERAESLATELESTRALYSESLSVHTTLLSTSIDSLESVISSKDSAIAQLASVKDSLAARAKSSSAVVSNGKAAHGEILGYYRTEVDKLPGDLSSYERRVALGEIRERTAKKFAISVKRLNEIREKNNLQY